jgi:hypothetical protein
LSTYRVVTDPDLEYPVEGALTTVIIQLEV